MFATFVGSTVIGELETLVPVVLLKFSATVTLFPIFTVDFFVVFRFL